MTNQGRSQSGPLQPEVQVQTPLTASHLALFLHLQSLSQFKPHLFFGHAMKMINKITFLNKIVDSF